jgi:cyclophilin family peptidyl-prolyl cis-trans isomerase
MASLHEQKQSDVYFDISIAGSAVGRIVMQLHDDSHPITAKNFRELCKGGLIGKSTGRPIGYQGNVFHRIIDGFMIQGGKNGVESESIYGGKFLDENLNVGRHNAKGVLSMANSGPHTNGSQFFITLRSTPHLDGKRK